MNGIHDMGGMQDMGPIKFEKNEPVFHATWEGRVYAMFFAVAATGKLRLGLRPPIENLSAAEYLRLSYYELWLTSLTENLVASDLLTRAELESGRTAAGSSKAALAVSPADAVAAIFRVPARRKESVVPRFQPGQPVRARNINPVTHTRLPRYARGKTGTIHRDHGVFAFMDTSAYGKPQHLYSVRFSAREVWGEQAAPQDSVYVDLYDDHLEPA
jgi:nitrile hydratase subunit beta